ncbi:MAG: Flp pilus assembly complex ATPase component TadA [Desulfovibrio sp.]|nr:Flp pilus assembly complex ATPase component TadA [Desulfovibrio sp.]
MSELLYPGLLRHTVSLSMLDDFLLWAVGMGASDIVLRAEDPPWIQKDGVWHATSTVFCLTQGETQMLTNALSGQEHKAGNVQRGMSADFAYSLRPPNTKVMQRFRVNVTATNVGHYIVLRPLPRVLPRLEDQALPKHLCAQCFPDNGLVVIAGVMGSGKSTLLAALLHAAICKKAYGGLGIGRQVLTLEQPIEFDLTSLPCHQRSAPLAQSEVERHISSWPHGVRSMTRRKGEIVMLGEARDEETLAAMLSIVEQGVTCYATVHAEDVAKTIPRIVNTFPQDERESRALSVYAHLRLILHQRLVPHRDPSLGRIALREYVIVDEALRRELSAHPFARCIPLLRKAMQRQGQSIVDDVTAKFAQGLVSAETYDRILREQEGHSKGGGDGSAVA